VLAVVRIVGLLVVIALIVTVGAWLLTGERRWLRLAWNIFRVALFAFVVILLLFAGEALLY
jgi:hypothetical protein